VVLVVRLLGQPQRLPELAPRLALLALQQQHLHSTISRKRNIKFRKGLVDGLIMGKYSGREGVVEGEEGEEEVH
jgi:hypothetical protein